MAGLRSPERCLTLFVSEQAVLIERPVGGASSVTEVPLQDVPALLDERFGVPRRRLDKRTARTMEQAVSVGRRHHPYQWCRRPTFGQVVSTRPRAGR